MANYTVVSITLQNETLRKLDSACGLIPRSAYIEKIVAEYLAKSKAKGGGN